MVRNTPSLQRLSRLRLGTSAVVSAGIVIIGVAVAQVYVILLGTGICQLDGC
jgi:hypothetical protein